MNLWESVFTDSAKRELVGTMIILAGMVIMAVGLLLSMIPTPPSTIPDIDVFCAECDSDLQDVVRVHEGPGTTTITVPPCPFCATGKAREPRILVAGMGTIDLILFLGVVTMAFTVLAITRWEDRP